LFYGFDDLFNNWCFFEDTGSWDGITVGNWGSDNWGGGGYDWGSSSNWGSVSKMSKSVSVSTISSKTSISMSVKTSMDSSVSSWVETFSGGSCQYGSEDKELVHIEGFGV
jgi:hypothetical protein